MPSLYLIYLSYQYADVINVYLHQEALITTHQYHFSLFQQFLTWSLFLISFVFPLFSHTLHVFFWHPVGLCGLGLQRGGTVTIHATYQGSNIKSGHILRI